MCWNLALMIFRFSNDKALELLQIANGLEVTLGEVSSLNEQAEGWVAGLQLVGHVLRGQSNDRVHQFTSEFSGTVRSIENYLWEEVLDKQSPEIRSFLALTSILNRFNAQICDAVRDRSDSLSIIRKIETDRLFVVALDAKGQWFRYHHLFADVLRERLVEEIPEDEVLLLHRRAAVWLAENGHTEDAARHAIASRDWDFANPLLEKTGNDLFNLDRNQSLYEWLRSVPDAALHKSPRLAFLLAYALIRTGRLQEAAVPMRIAEEAWTLEADTFGLGMVRLLHALQSVVRMEPQRIVDHSLSALEMLSEALPGPQAMGYIMLGSGYLYLGDCLQAEQR